MNQIETATKNTAAAERALAEAETARRAAADHAADSPGDKKALAALKAAREDVATCEDILNSARDREAAARKAASDAHRAAGQRRAEELAVKLAPARVAECFAPTIEALRGARKMLIDAHAAKQRIIDEQLADVDELRRICVEHGLDLAELKARYNLPSNFSGEIAAMREEDVTLLAQHALSADRRADGHEHGPLVRLLFTHHA